LADQTGIPKGALIAIGDMLDYCAKVQPGQEVLILAEIDGIYDKTVDREAISWVQSCVQARGSNASVLWIDETPKVHAWRIPPIVKAAMAGCHILINHSFNLTTEDICEFGKYYDKFKIHMVRNFATTSSLLCTTWAQTPYELVSEIRHQVGLQLTGGKTFVITDTNGTHLEGMTMSPEVRPGVPATGESCAKRREEAGGYRPWPEWLHPPLRTGNANGILIFDCMLSWWSRYIGISPYFAKPVQLTITNSRITDIKGGDEADALRRFLTSMVKRVGDGVYDLEFLHTGVHPQAIVGPHQCPNPLMRRIIDHSYSSNIHFHIGAPAFKPEYPYWMHVTADIRNPTFKVGNTCVHDRGYLMALDNPEVRAIEKKYPGRPGVDPMPRNF
jgi:hypothetical protein